MHQHHCYDDEDSVNIDINADVDAVDFNVEAPPADELKTDFNEEAANLDDNSDLGMRVNVAPTQRAVKVYVDAIAEALNAAIAEVGGNLDEWIAELGNNPIELRATADYIQWRLRNSEGWTNLIAIADITGPKGDPADQTQFRNNGTHIQWQLVTEGEVWHDLVPLTDITGPRGDAVELRNSSGYIQWKYTEDAVWSNLVSLTEITGPQGNQPFYYQGEYDNGADYAIGDAVTYLGSLWYRSGEPNPGYPPGPGSPYWTLLVEKGSTGDKGEPSYCIGVFASVAALLSAWPDGPGMEHLNYWAFAMDAGNDRILWVYRPDPLNNGDWAREQIDLPVVPLDTSTDLGGTSPSDSVAPSQAAVKSYVDGIDNLYHAWTDADLVWPGDPSSGDIVRLLPGKLFYAATAAYKVMILPGQVACFYNDNGAAMQIVNEDSAAIGYVPTSRFVIAFAGNTSPGTVSTFAFPWGPSSEIVNRIYISSSPPASDGDEGRMWLDSETGRLYCKYGGAWGEIAKPF